MIQSSASRLRRCTRSRQCYRTATRPDADASSGRNARCLRARSRSAAADGPLAAARGKDHRAALAETVPRDRRSAHSCQLYIRSKIELPDLMAFGAPRTFRSCGARFPVHGLSADQPSSPGSGSRWQPPSPISSAGSRVQAAAPDSIWPNAWLGFRTSEASILNCRESSDSRTGRPGTGRNTVG